LLRLEGWRGLEDDVADQQPLARLHLREDQARAMLDHLRSVYPEEGCGLLAVPAGDDAVVRVYPIRNIAARPRVRYEGEPLELLDAFQEMERAGWRLGAIYHSHPSSPAWPSAEDLRQARYPSALTLIVSLARPDQPQLGLFAIGDGQISERPLVITAAGATLDRNTR
jgi:proteasome lid subunit RPN8/RPN11